MVTIRAVPVEVGKLYMISVLELSKNKNLEQDNAHECHTTDVHSELEILKIETHSIGVVLRYHEPTKTAVVLIGSPDPLQPHQCIRWYGTLPKPFETSQVLRPHPLKALYGYHGHLRFSHAIHLRVLEFDEYARGFMSRPNLIVLREIVDRYDDMEITLPGDQITLLKTLHTMYWEGKRYSREGLLLYGGLVDIEEDAQSTEPRRLRSPSDFSIPSSSTTSEIYPRHQPWRVSTSTTFGGLLERRVERAVQIELLDEDEDLTNQPVPSTLAVFLPLTREMLALPLVSVLLN